MIAEFQYPAQRAEVEEFVAANPGCQIWHDGAVMKVYTDGDLPPGVDTE